jgi:uncharacterized protein
MEKLDLNSEIKGTYISRRQLIKMGARAFAGLSIPYRDIYYIPAEENAQLTETSLGDGLFKSMMMANVSYLLSVSEVDDMLWHFRNLAGDPNPPGHRTGWEIQYPAHAAQFLMGAGNTLCWMHVPELKKKLDKLIEGIKACRKQDGALLVPGVGTKLEKQWGYSMQMFAHGMVAAALSGNADAYPLLNAAYRNFASLLRTQSTNFPLTNDLNYQGHITNLLVYFSPFGRLDDLKLAEEYFVSPAWMDALSKRRSEAIWVDTPKWPHCYEIVAFEAYLDHYRATKEKRFLDAMLGAWELISGFWRDVAGTISICEHVKCPPKSYSLSRLKHVGEFCGTVFWIRFNHRLHLLFPNEERYINEIEQAIYNAVSGAIDLQGKGIHYHMVLEGRKNEGDKYAEGPVPSRRHTCCEGNGTWLYGNLPEYIFSCLPKGLTVNLYHNASTVWSSGDKKVRVSVNTRFPEEELVELNINTSKSVKMSVKIRIPQWCEDEVLIYLNGQQAGTGKPGTFFDIERKWMDSENIRFRLPMSLRVHRYEGEDKLEDTDRYAIFYGPFLLACVGNMDDPALGRGYDSFNRSNARVPRIRKDPFQVSNWLIPDSDQSGYFRIEGVTEHRFIPYWKLGNEESFTCYPGIGKDV